MAQYTLKINLTGNNIKTMQAKKNKVVEALKALGIDATASVAKIDKAESRADRLSEAQGMVEDAKGEVEALRDEMQDWYDNLPENFQSGDKGQACEEARDALDQIITDLENVDFNTVEFPGMY